MINTGTFDTQIAPQMGEMANYLKQILVDTEPLMFFFAGIERMAGDINMTAGRTVNSQNNHWCTPPKYVESVRKVFGGEIDLDPCSNKWSLVNAETEYLHPKSDGLKESWDFPTIYVNPPYGADRTTGTTIKHWLAKCAYAHNAYNSSVLALVPVATNTRHWKDFVWGQANAVCFLYATRLKFRVNGVDEGKGAPMSCAMIYWGTKYNIFYDVFIEYGAVVNIEHLKGKEIGIKNNNNGLKNQNITNLLSIKS